MASGTFDSIVMAHRAVREFVERALQEEDVGALLPQIERVWDILPEHFFYEEQAGGFLDQIRLRAPGGEEHVTRLLAEHRRFESEVPELVDAIRRGDADALERLHEFAHQIREHELLEGLLGGLKE